MTERHGMSISLASMLALVACFALNFWLFRVGVLWGILGLNVSKHVVIAVLCQRLGVDRGKPVSGPPPSPAVEPTAHPPAASGREFPVGASGASR